MTDHKYEITSLRKDVSTDGRHAKVEFSLIGRKMRQEEIFQLIQFIQTKMEICLILIMVKKILRSGNINFIGDAENRIKEDYLRILRYVRFFINYSNQSHDLK